jgi:hypothetical protein
MSLKTYLWHLIDGQPQPVEAAAPLWLAGGDGGHRPSPERRDGAVMIAPIQPLRQAVAAALVPDAASGSIARDGIPLAAGLHALPHGARLELDGSTFWISSQSAHEETSYDPQHHGPDVFCFITKARLAAGDAITICPGTPGKTCGVIYKKAAWDMALQSPRPFRCPSCGYDPRRSQWQPPRPAPPATLDDLLAIVSRRAEELNQQAENLTPF